MTPRPVAVIGLGRLGAPFAALLAARGTTVHGVDRNARVRSDLRAGRTPVEEPDLPETLREAGPRLVLFDAIEAAVREVEAVFLLVPTPSRSDGGYDLDPLREALEATGRGIAHRGDRPLVCVISTVLPGDTEGPLRVALARGAGRTPSEVDLCYTPVFIALGSVLRDLSRPDFLLLGGAPESTARAESILRRLAGADPPAAHMSAWNAELAKLAVNTYVTTKISFANALALLCEAVPGGDVDAVTGAIGLDKRIGGAYLRGGLPYGGPCFPRDNAALRRVAQRLGVALPLAEATERTNEIVLESLRNLVLPNLPASGAVGILGLAYKPKTPVTEAAPGVLLARDLRARGFEILAHDPLARAEGIPLVEDPRELFLRCDAVVLSTPWPAYRDLAPPDAALRARVLVDGWRFLDPARWTGRLRYLAVGRGGV